MLRLWSLRVLWCVFILLAALRAILARCLRATVGTAQLGDGSVERRRCCDQHGHDEGALSLHGRRW